MPLQRNSAPQRFRPALHGQHQQRTVEGPAGDRSWPSTVMVFGIFVLVISFWWVSSRTLISYMALARWFALFAFVGNLIPYTRAGQRLGMERLEWFLFNLLAVGPFVFSALLWVNLLIHGPERFAVMHYSGGIEGVRRHWMEKGDLPPSTPIEIGAGMDPDAINGPHSEHLIGQATGVLGYEVISTYRKFGKAGE